jgi:hypothetical protein
MPQFMQQPLNTLHSKRTAILLIGGSPTVPSQWDDSSSHIAWKLRGVGLGTRVWAIMQTMQNS